MTDPRQDALLGALRRLGQESGEPRETVALVWNLAYRWLCPRLRANGARQPEDDAADIAQDVTIRVLRCHSTCRAASEQQAVAWVRAITRNLLVDHRRRERRREAALTTFRGEVATSSVSVDNRGPATDKAAASLLVMLRDDDSTVVQLRLGVGATWREVGKVLGCSPTAAKRRFQRLLTRLRRAVFVGRLPQPSTAPLAVQRTDRASPKCRNPR